MIIELSRLEKTMNITKSNCQQAKRAKYVDLRNPISNNILRPVLVL